MSTFYSYAQMYAALAALTERHYPAGERRLSQFFTDHEPVFFDLSSINRLHVLLDELWYSNLSDSAVLYVIFDHILSREWLAQLEESNIIGKYSIVFAFMDFMVQWDVVEGRDLNDPDVSMFMEKARDHGYRVPRLPNPRLHTVLTPCFTECWIHNDRCRDCAVDRTVFPNIGIPTVTIGPPDEVHIRPFSPTED